VFTTYARFINTGTRTDMPRLEGLDDEERRRESRWIADHVGIAPD